MSTTEKQVVEELIDTMDGYITLLGDCLANNAAFMHTHGIKETDANIKSGKDFREKISLLKMELKQLNP